MRLYEENTSRGFSLIYLNSLQVGLEGGGAEPGNGEAGNGVGPSPSVCGLWRA